MKRLLLPILLLLAGCATSTPDKLASAERDIQTASGIATTFVLLSEAPADRASLAKSANAVATTVHDTADKGTLDPATVKQFAADALLKSGLKNKEAAAYLLGAITDLIDEKLKIDLGGDKTATLRALLRGAASGVLDATKVYLTGAIQ